jgi:CotS family spore coat protein
MSQKESVPSVRELESILNKPVLARRSFHHLWMIETEGKSFWIAKSVRNSLHLRWWLQVDSILRQRGFMNMLPIWTDQKNWMLTPFCAGNRGSYRLLDHVQRAVYQLARFHHLGRYLPIPPPSSQAAFLLAGRIKRRLDSFAQMMHHSDSIPGEEGEFLRHYAPLFYQDGIRTWQQLQQTPLYGLIRKDVQQRAVAHRDLASHNWLFTKNRCWLIDFDTAGYDGQIGDLWQITARILHEHRWSERVWQLILETYQAVRPLSQAEKEVLVALLAFPNDFFREASGWWRRRKGFHQDAVFSFLKRLAHERKLWQKQVRSFREMLY